MNQTAMRKIILIPAGLLVLILGAILALLLLVDANQFRDPIRAQLEKRLQRSVTIGQLGLKIIPLSIRLEDVAIGESAQFPSQAPFAKVKEIDVRMSLPALLRRQVNVQSLRVIEPQIELIRNVAGVWNASSLGGAGGSQTGGGGGGSLEIADLQIQNGRVGLTDLQQHKARTVYDHIDLALRNYGPGRPFELDGGIQVPGPSGSAVNAKVNLQGRDSAFSGKGNVEVAGKSLRDPARAEFQIQGDLNTGVMKVIGGTLKVGAVAAEISAELRTKAEPPAMTGELRLNNAALADLLRLAEAFGAAPGISGSGTLSMSARVNGPMSDPAIDATGALRDAKLQLPQLTKPLEVQTAAIRAGKNSVSLNDVVLGLGSMHARGSLAATDFANPQLALTAAIDKLDVSELQQMLADAPAAKKGRATTGSASTVHGTGTITAGSIVYQQIALTDVHATCKLENGIIRLDPLSSKAFGGEQTGSIALDTRQAQSTFNINSKLIKVDANQLLSATTPMRKLFFGTLNSDIQVQANPAPGQDFTRALNGTVKLDVTDGRLAGVQLLNELAGIAKLLGYSKRSESYTKILKLAGTLHLRNGIANTDDLHLDFDGGSLNGSGTLGLTDQQLKMRLTTVLAKEINPAGGKTQIAGLMSTVLANSKGELVIPALVSGTLDKLRFQPDPERMAKMKLEGLLPTRDNPAGAASRIQGILGALTGSKSESQQAQPGTPAATQQKKKGILDILDSMRKKPEQK